MPLSRVVFSRAKLYPDTAVNYTDVDDVNVVPSACQWQGCRVATDRLRLVELSVFVETDRLINEQVVLSMLKLNYFIKVKGPGIYIPSLTGKPAQQRFTFTIQTGCTDQH